MSDLNRGYAHVGDPAWYRSSNRLPWQKKCEVVAVGLPNEFGHELNVRVRTETDGEVELTPFPPANFKDPEPRPQVLLLPSEPPAVLMKVLHLYKNLIAARAPAFSDVENFRLFCTTCEEWVYVGQTYTEVADVYYNANRSHFQAGKPEVTNSEFEVVCGCPNLAYRFCVTDYFGDQHENEDK